MMLERRDDQHETEDTMATSKKEGSAIQKEQQQCTSGAASATVTPASMAPRMPYTAATATPASSHRTGRWTPDEKILFLYGLRRFGKGRWKKMSVYLPNRSLVQIKSHAQKVLKRLDAGENIFRRLEENERLVDNLVVQAAKQQRCKPIAPAPSSSISKSAKVQVVVAKQRKRPVSNNNNNKKLTSSDENQRHVSYPAVVGTTTGDNSFTSSSSCSQYDSLNDSTSGAEVAAAALCQLSALGGWESSSKSTNPSLHKIC